MKRLLAALTAVLLMLTGVAATAEEAQTAVVTVRVLDEEGNALRDAEVVVYASETNAVVDEYTSGAVGHTVTGLREGMYTVRATAAETGYSDAETFYCDGDQEIELVVRGLQEGTEVTIGSFTRMSGAFFTDLWGNNTSDIDVRTLLHGLSTVAWTSDLQYGLDTTVLEAADTEVNAAGDKTYTFTLREGLMYNDGTPVTAADYVFSVLLQSAKETAALGVSPMTYAQLNGQAAYLSGESDVFSGARLLDERTFSLTISARSLPYFYELTYVSVTPYPMSVIAPGCAVRDDGRGAYIEGDFTKELLEETILNPETGYLSHPGVTSGPYQLVSYDAQAGTAAFTVNPYYTGNYEGRKPVIERLALCEVKYENALEQLADGTVDIINKATDGAFITEGLAQFAEGAIGTSNYLRTGFGFLAFACEESATQSQSVRQAMAMCFDRGAMISDFLQSYGMEVYSFYGLGQWMAQPYTSTMQDEVTVYELDTDAAVQLLEADGWTLNENGDAFKAGTDTVRYRRNESGALEPLAIRFAQVEGNAAAAWVAENYAPVLESVGFSFETAVMPFSEMLRHYYRQDERTYNLMYLATNFAVVFDPYYTFNTDPAYQGEFNTSGIVDEELMNIARKMRETESEDTETYSAYWLELMQRYSEVLPTLPIYSNIYYDFFDDAVMDYAPNAQWSWPAAILYAYIEA